MVYFITQMVCSARNGLALLSLYGFLFQTEEFLVRDCCKLIVVYTKSSSGLFRMFHTLLVNDYMVYDIFYRQEFGNTFYWDIKDAFNENIGLTNIDDMMDADNIVFYHDKNESSIKDEFYVSIFSLDHMVYTYLAERS